jgi:2-methylisocitrate lyase-like PEP mutase family enzyme
MNKKPGLYQQECYELFRALHERSSAFIMPNAWDGTSALLLKGAGFAALGSSSLAIAFSLGRHDGCRAVSRATAIANAQLLTQLTKLPVNGDLEDGFGPGPEDCALTVNAAINAGLAGLGIEDTTADPAHPIHSFDSAVARVKAAATAARGRIVLTARTDNFLQGRPDLDDTIRRLAAFADVGADVLYAPGLPDIDSIMQVVRAVAPKPLNVVVGPTRQCVPLSLLESLGVRRVSLGGALYRRTMTILRDAASALASGDIASAVRGAMSKEDVDVVIATQVP